MLNNKIIMDSISSTINGNTYNSNNEIIGEYYELCRDNLHQYKQPHFIFHMKNKAEYCYTKYLEQNKLTRELDSGIDLICPFTTIVPAQSTILLDLDIIVECNIYNKNYDKNTLNINIRPFILVPRSSIYRTPLQLANSIGIIDAGYRGVLKAAIRNNSDIDYEIKEGDRLVQICLPNLDYNYIFSFVKEEDELIASTERGMEGFGSTG
tara:strand:- start:1683 stop:2309 length:627 start_codon:yes stop_codon:yes gene_type:complete